MQVTIEENGTQVFFLQSGEYQMDISAGTFDGGCTVDLKSGPDEAGARHVPVKDVNGVAIQADGANYGDTVITGGKWFSVVTAGFGSSAGLVVDFRKARAE